MEFFLSCLGRPITARGMDQSDPRADKSNVTSINRFCRCGDLGAACEAARQAGPGLGDILNLLQAELC